MSDNNISYIQIPYQDLDSELSRYIDLDFMKKPREEEYVIHFEKTKKLLEYFMKKSEEKEFKLFSFKLPTPPDLPSASQLVIHIKLEKLLKKYRNLNADFYSSCVVKISRVLCFLNDCKTSGFIAAFKAGEYKKNANFEFNTMKSVKTVISKIAQLDRLSKKYKYDSLYPTISEQLMHDSLKNFQSLIESKNDYCEISGFDDLFFCYIFTQNKYDIFKPYIDDTVTMLKNTIFGNGSSDDLWNSPKIQFLGIAKCYNAIGEVLNPSNPKQATILRCAVVRFYFDQLYVRCPYLNVKLDHTQYKRNCEIVREMTCEELAISSVMLKPEQLKMKFKDVAPNYVKALDSISQMQFYTDPAAFAWLSLKAMNYIDFIAKQNMNKVNENQEEPDQNNTILAFDDIFSVYWPLMAMWPLPDPMSLALFIKTAVGLKLTSQMEYAKTVFVSAIEYIKNFQPDNV